MQATQHMVPLLLALGLTALTAVYAVGAEKPKMATDIPAEITTPDKVETRLGTLQFFDGLPDKATVEKIYDNLDFMRGVEVFLNTMPGASLVALRHGFRGVGAVDDTIGIFETLMDSKSLFLTPNTDTVYALTWLDLKNGPVVVESPPNVLGIVDDFWFRYVTDLGNAGPDKGQGSAKICVKTLQSREGAAIIGWHRVGVRRWWWCSGCTTLQPRRPLLIGLHPGTLTRLAYP